MANHPVSTTAHQLPYDRLIELGIAFLIVFTPLAYGTVEAWAIAVFEAVTAFVVFIWILKMLARGQCEFIKNPLTLFFFIFSAYICFQLLAPPYRLPVGQTGIFEPLTIYAHATRSELLKIISYALIFFVSLNTIKTKRQIVRISSIIIATGFIMSIFFMMRYFGMKVPRGFINRDHLAAYLGMIIPLTLGFLFIPPFANSQKPPARGESASGGNTENSLPAGRPGKPNNEPRTLLFFCVIVMGAALFFTMSRGGMFSFIVTLLFMMILVLRRRSIRRRGWILSVVVIFIILAIIWLGATPVIERILSIKGEITDHYFGGRLPVWQATLNIIKDYPIFGTGLGTFNYIFPKYQPAQIMSKHYTYAHSDFLELLSEAGIAGFILSLAFGLWLLADLFRRFNQRHDPWVVGLSIGFFGSLASIFFHSFTDFNLHIPANTLLLTLVLSLFIGTINCGHKREISSVIISKVGKVVLYPVTILSVGLFIFMSTKPAIADYYFRQATGDKIQAQIDLLKRASKFDSTNAKYDYYLGESYSKLGALSLQFAAYKKAVQLSLMSSKYHQSLAWTYGQLADLPRPYKRRSLINRKSLTLTFESNYMRKAFSEFEKAIALSPNNSYRHRAYAIWLFNHPTKKNIEKGVEVYRKAIEIEPKKTSEALSKYYKYQKDYKKLIDILPGTEESDCNALWFLIAKKGLKDAVDFAKEGLKTYSDNANLHFWIADRSFYDKDLPWEFTEEHYQIAFKNAPEDAYYRLWYGIHLHHRGEYEKALKSLETSVKLGLSSQNEEQAKKYIAECKEKSF